MTQLRDRSINIKQLVRVAPSLDRVQRRNRCVGATTAFNAILQMQVDAKIKILIIMLRKGIM